MKNFLRHNSLSLVMLILFLISIAGQAITGHKVYNDERSENGLNELSFEDYLSSGHFISATFENWESEFFKWDYL